MTLTERIKKFFGISRTEPAAPEPHDVLISIMADSLAMNLKRMTGSAMEAVVLQVKPEQFERFIEPVRSGYISSTFCGSDSFSSMLIIPADDAAALAGLMKIAAGKAEDSAVTGTMLDALEGNLFHLFLPQCDPMPDFIRLKRKFGASEHESITWMVADSLLFSLKLGEASAGLMVPRELWDGLRVAASDKDYAWRLRSIAVNEYIPGNVPDDETASLPMDIAKPAEFMLGRFFLPFRMRLDGLRISSSFNRVLSGATWPAADTMCVSLELKVHDEIFRLWYGFEGYTAAKFSEAAGPFDEMFRGMLRDTLASMKSFCPEMKISGVRYNSSCTAPADLSCCVMLCALLKINGAAAGTRIAVPVEFMNLIARNILPAWEIKQLKENMRSRMLCILSVNSALFARGISTFINSCRGGDDRMPVDTSCLPFYEFAGLIPDSDLRIVAQNFILPRFSADYMKLFAVGVAEESPAGQKMRRIYRVESGIERIEAFLPQSVKDKPGDDMNWTEAELFDDINRETMRALYGSVAGDRLLLSGRARFILKNQFFDAVQGEYRKQLDALLASGEPFASLEGVPYNARQLAVSRVSDRDLALALMDSGDRMLGVTPLMSRARKEKVLDEVDLARKRSREGAVAPEDIVRAIMAIKESIEREKGRLAE